MATCLLLSLFALLLGGCSALPPAQPGPPSKAMKASNDTALGRIALAAAPDPDLSGFRLMPGGDFALSARLELAQRAERQLDVQYYHIENDATGRHFLRALRDAARRGVKVRLLMDDLYTSGEDELLLGLAATPNFELRLYNPFRAGRSGGLLRRFASSPFDFDRLQRRMHNKLFIADGAIAVAGGRNIGGRYYGQTSGENFLDLDTVVAGALLPRLGVLFDQFWNSEYVIPIQSMAQSDLSKDELMRRFDEATDAVNAPPPRPPAPNDLLGYAPLLEDLNAGKLNLIWATAEAYADSPDRVIGKQSTYRGVPLLDVDSVRYNVIEQVRRARREVVISSPYLIPGKAGLDVMAEVRRRNVKLTLVTNSLAATDEPLVHTGYRRYRRDMLKLGVELYELSSNRTRGSVRLGIFGASVGRLHAKTAVFDREQVFVGSMNFDPRSDVVNTEIGLFIRSREMALQIVKLSDQLRQQGAWKVQLSADGDRLEWRDNDADNPQTLQQEPDSGLWDRLMLDITAPLAPEGLL